ncbi:4a-hydroxytetrahydrobiopterin dehydratase [Thiomicrospira sp. WB1]|uniref:4a-hydroxytetrahydrobiopterin dehydratase n=1 Tax=Thiomicrospira sp. WB1 TaxID=1685380 RepID=UPI00074AD8B0|nr:4a-hydroxytetrahydrobiopterin dehydratase [Thiomicrospira sp. WB1]KUJ72727.1 pterin dehydratase [Thiomicrospira sp. WB1]
MTTIKNLAESHCEPIQPDAKGLIIPTVESYLSQMDGWEAPLNYKSLYKTFRFKNYLQTVHFVNAVTWIAQQEDHHPRLCFDYNTCKVELSTHVIKGLSQNDFILAAKIDALFD